MVNEKVLNSMQTIAIFREVVQKHPWVTLTMWRLKMSQLSVYCTVKNNELVEFTLEDFITMFYQQDYRCVLCGPNSDPLILLSPHKKACVDQKANRKRNLMYFVQLNVRPFGRFSVQTM